MYDSPVKNFDSEKTESAKPLPTSDHRVWPTIPFEPAKGGDRPSAFPVLHRVALGSDSWGNIPNRVVEPRLDVLVNRSVDPDVVVHLRKAVDAGEIRFVLAEMKTPAAFDVVGGHARMLLNVEDFLSIDSEDKIIEFMLAISHEFVHYQQWKRTTYVKMRRMFDEGYVSGPGDCSAKYLNEREAYKRMCRIGNAVNYRSVWTDDPKTDLCTRVESDKAFDQAFYYFSVFFYKELFRGCDDIWWNLAGGPHF